MTQTRSMTPAELQNALHDGREIALLDVREDGEFGEDHLLFATPLPYSRLELGIGALVPRKNARIVLCDDGVSGVAQRAATRLTALGYSDLTVLAGGTRDWKAAGYVLFKGVNVPSKLFGELGYKIGSSSYDGTKLGSTGALGVGVGYAAWLNDNVTIEPMIKYSALSTKPDGGDSYSGSAFGVMINFGIYLGN